MKQRRRPPLPIIYEDDRIVVIDKPAGLLTTSTRLPGRAARAAQHPAEIARRRRFFRRLQEVGRPRRFSGCVNATAEHVGL